MGRRSKKLVNAGVIAVIAVFLVSACGGADPTSAPEPRVITATPGPTATPQIIVQTAPPAATAAPQIIVQTAPPAATAAPQIIVQTAPPAATAAPQIIVQTPTPRPAPTPPPTPEPSERYGTLTWASVEPPRSMLPDGGGFAIRSPVYDLLILPDGDPLRQGEGLFTLVPALATEWSFSSDSTSLSMSIASGSVCHNGEALDAEDVAFLPEYYLNTDFTPVSASQIVGVWRAKQLAARAVDSQTVEFFKEDGARLAPDFIAFDIVQRAAGVACKDYVQSVGYEEAAENPIGSGPFEMVDRSPGSFKYERTGDHNLYDPPMDAITIVVVGEDAVRVALLEAGRADVAKRVGLDAAQRGKREGFTLWSQPATFNIWTIFGGTLALEKGSAPWVNSREVRLAMAMAIDRQTMNEQLQLGLATPLNTHHASANGSHIEPIEYDPERAKQLLADAGYPDGFEFDMPLVVIRGTDWIPDEHLAIANYWERIGLKPNIRKWDFVNEALPVWLNPDADPQGSDNMIWVMKWTTDLGAPLAHWSKWYTPSFPLYRDEKLVSLAEQMRDARSVDVERFNALEQEAFSYLHEEVVGIIPIYTIGTVDVLGDGFVRWDNAGWSEWSTIHGLVFER